MRSRTTAVAGLAAVALTAAACGGNGGNGGDEETGAAGSCESVTLGVAHQGADDSGYELALQSLAEDLDSQTDGRVTIETYPASQLGGEVQTLEQVESGALEMVVATSGATSAFVPDLAATELPYLFDDLEHARAALDGELGEYYAQQLEESGFVNLGFWEMGYKNLTNSQRPIVEAADVAGLSIRVLENPILVDTYRALEADPVALPFPETYPALQQGVVDGYEGPYVAFVDANITEVQDHLTELGMTYGAVHLLINQDTFESLCSEDQETLTELGAASADEQRSLNDQFNEDYKQVAIERGVEVVPYEDVDLDSFREATSGVADNYPEWNEIIELVDAARP